MYNNYINGRPHPPPTPPTKDQIKEAKNELLYDPDGNIDDPINRKDVEPSDENKEHVRVLQYLIDNPEYEKSIGGSRRRRPSRKYKKSKRVFRKKSRSTRRR
jgi:hypothetical protein